MRSVKFHFFEPLQIERKPNTKFSSRENRGKIKEVNKTKKILCKVATKFSHKLWLNSHYAESKSLL